ncbi:hypothetical protein [Aureimonas leprariae]|uniref:hypothetical protein n=1 Tax=Plantimonas leprariae TaxID=2615207 RepID=UPI00192A61A7|nr:hypothetical protein [Aureimonas leprariae]
MSDRAIETTVTFANAFAIDRSTGIRPAGTYRVVVEENEIRGVSFLSFNQVATLFHVPAIGTSGFRHVFSVDLKDLDAAVETDSRTPSPFGRIAAIGAADLNGTAGLA